MEINQTSVAFAGTAAVAPQQQHESQKAVKEEREDVQRSTANNAAQHTMLAPHTWAIWRSTNVTGPARRRRAQNAAAQAPNPAKKSSRYGHGSVTPRNCR